MPTNPVDEPVSRDDPPKADSAVSRRPARRRFRWRSIRKRLATAAVSPARVLHAPEDELLLPMRRLGSIWKFLRALADRAPNMMAYWDDRRICRFANLSYRQWFGHGKSGVVGFSRIEVIGDPAEDESEPAFAAALAGNAQSVEFPLVHADGQQVHHVWMHHMPDLRRGRVAGVFVLVVDVSALKQAEWRLKALNEQLIQARDRAEAANRAKSAFLANISHDIRTPLSAIIGLTHLMLRELPSGAAAPRLRQVADAAQYLLGVVNEVLDLARIESGKAAPEQNMFLLDDLLDRSVALVADRAAAKGLAIELLPNEWGAEALQGDPTKLSQALMNLLDNAVKYTRQGKITVSCVQQPDPGGSVLLRFCVTDTGPGIAPDQVERVFEAFEQGERSGQRLEGGTGLGLTITKRLAQLMGGDAGVVSQPGQGSSFWFTARLNQPADSPVAAPVDDAEPCPHEKRLRERFPGVRLLLAEDNPVNQEVGVALLESAGCRVDCAEDGVEALALAGQHDYAAILLDMQMPRMDGLAAARRIRQLPQHAHTPLIAMTANAFGEDRRACLAAGMDDHLPKPVDAELLYATLLHWLERRAPAPAGPAAPSVAAETPAPAAASAAGSRFDGIAGLTMSRALLYLPGRDAVFARVLGQFVDNYASGMPLLASAVQDACWVEARRQLHGLRGACGAIGALGVLAEAQAIEQMLMSVADGHVAPEGLAPRLLRLQQCLQDLVDALAERLARTPAAPEDAFEPTPGSTHSS